MTPPARLPTTRRERALCAGVALACLAYSLASAGIGWHNSLLGPHGFRQTQTALSTHSILQGGPWLAYETPVLGAPWSIPFEFPLFQWLVAMVVSVSHAPLDQAGRWVSEVFFYATLLPAYAVLGSLGVRPAHRLLLLSLLLVSPIYLYWSRAFMVESTALFCAMSYLAVAARALERRRLGSLAAAGFFGALAATIKVTTFVPFLLAATAFLVARRGQAGAAAPRRDLGAVVPWIAVTAIVPLAAAVAWTWFTDSVKAENPLAAGFITSSALAEWNFGTAAQRLSSRTWLTMWNRTLPDVVGDGVVAVAAALLALVGRRRTVSFLACVGLFVSAPLLFTNLHVVHSYYPYANGVFLIAAVGLSAVGWLEREDRWWWLGAALAGAAIVVGVWRHRVVDVPVQRTAADRVLDTAVIVSGVTAVDETVLVLGLDWNPELPYYARRRALMNRESLAPDHPRMRRALANLGDRPPAAMVVCQAARQRGELIEAWLEATGLSPVADRSAHCDVYSRARTGGVK